MKQWAAVLLGVAVLFAFSPQVFAGEACGHGHHKKGEEYLSKKDADKDGKTSKEEWDKNSDEKFKAIDSDGDGFISSEEMKACKKAKWGKYKGKKGACVKSVPGAEE